MHYKGREDIYKAWSSIKGRLLAKYPELQPFDLEYKQGNEEELFKGIQDKTGLSRDDLIREINTIMKSR